jgi:hypothetical protein
MSLTQVITLMLLLGGIHHICFAQGADNSSGFDNLCVRVPQFKATD